MQAIEWCRVVSVGNVSMNVCAKFRCAPLRIKKALGIYREPITARTTSVAFWDPPSGSKNASIRHYLPKSEHIRRAGHASLPGPTAPSVTELLQLPVPGCGTVYRHISEMLT